MDLPAGLVEAARDAVGFKSKTDTVVFALKEVVRRNRLEDLKALVQTINFEFDPAELRRKERQRA